MDFFGNGDMIELQGTPTYPQGKNQEVLRNLKDEISSIDQEILELQSNLGIAMNRKSYNQS